MKLNSIFTKITLIFLFSIVLLVTLLFFYQKNYLEQQHELAISYHKGFAQNLKEQRLPPKEVINLVEQSEFELVLNPRDVFDRSQVVYRQMDFETLLSEKEYYFHVVTPRFRILFKDLNTYTKSDYTYFMFFAFFIILIVLYIWLIKSLRPLKDLRESILDFSDGNLNIDCRSEQKDEIGDVANEFFSAAKKIELLLESRQLFLRTVMHELKTPIAKGRIVSELIDDEKQSKRLVTIFEKLEFLINDFAKIEQIVSKNFDVQTNKFSLEDIVFNAKSMLMIDNFDEKVNLEIKNDFKLECDIDLLTLVFKNLIDNAFKYSSNGQISILQAENKISFISKGKRLELPFEDYFIPFHNTTKSKNHGMGLGLYIVKSILDRHKMRFVYKYVNGNNIFEIVI